MTNVIQLPYYGVRDIEPLCADLRAGRGAFVLLGESPVAFLEVAGPKGLPAWKLLCNSPYPQVSLRTSFDGPPLVLAEANRAFPGSLDEIAAKVGPGSSGAARRAPRDLGHTALSRAVGRRKRRGRGRAAVCRLGVVSVLGCPSALHRAFTPGSLGGLTPTRHYVSYTLDPPGVPRAHPRFRLPPLL